MLCFLRILKKMEDSPPRSPVPAEDQGNGQPMDIAKTESASAGGIKLILAGYSYGSLVASHLPTIGGIIRLFREMHQGSPVQEISSTAERIFTGWRESLQMGMEQHHSKLFIDRERAEGAVAGHSSADPEAIVSMLVSVPISISYLLVSPLLPPISNFLTFFSPLSLSIGADASAQRKHVPCPKPTDQLLANRTLAVYGNQDTFASTKKLRKWSRGLAHCPHSKFQYREVDGAGHFWKEDGAEAQLRSILAHWLQDWATPSPVVSRGNASR